MYYSALGGGTYLTSMMQSDCASRVISMSTSEILEVISELSRPLDHLPNGVPVTDVLKIQKLGPCSKAQLRRDREKENILVWLQRPLTFLKGKMCGVNMPF